MRVWWVATLAVAFWGWGSAQPAHAWNRAGHQVCGAIAYAELKAKNPDALARILTILKTHPAYTGRWASSLKDVPEGEQDLYIFMLAARWADDIRGDPEYNHSFWHFIDYPYKPPGQPDSVKVADPLPENIVVAFANNVNIVKSQAPDVQKAVALCWIFHLIGDVHQPLHTVSLFTTELPAPEGDQGGNRIYMRAREGAATIKFHAFWDGLIIGSDRFQETRNEATRLRRDPNLARDQFRQLATTDFEQWAKRESFDLAVHRVYLDGKFLGSTDAQNGAVVPAGYLEQSKSTGEHQLTLSGYRLADVLEKLAAAQR